MKIRSLILCLGLALGGCSYFDAPSPEAQLVSVAARPAPEPLKVEDIISSSTDGRVQVYSLDEPPVAPEEAPPPAPAPLPAVQAPKPPDGMVQVEKVEAVPVDQPLPVAASDPSVQVFPLPDDAPKMPALPETQAPKLQPPSQAWKPYPEPFSKKKTPPDAGPAKSVVYFKHGSSSLSADDLNMLSTLVRNFEGQHIQGVFVDGYASTRSAIKGETQRKAVNLKMSLARAYSVSEILIKLGLPAELLETRGHGEDGDSDNSRRVEITSTPAGQ